MPVLKKFICFSYPQIDFYFSESNVPAAFFSSENDFKEGKLHVDVAEFFKSEMPFVDFDLLARLFSSSIKTLTGRTSLIFKGKNVFNNGEDFALVTSGNCKIIEKKLSDFSLFSDFYSPYFVSNGILAWSFAAHKPAFLIDLENFLKCGMFLFGENIKNENSSC